ncbi:MAG: beta-lactamase family protein [Geobacter sp.]|nr:beta-lactamase family protein [Geobacter sp.]
MVLLCFIVSFAAPAAGQDGGEGDSRTALIDMVMQSAISRELIAGGVVLVGDRQRDLLVRAYGRKGPMMVDEPMRDDTLFDVASLTKVVATTPAIMKLVEEGRLSLVDPVIKWFPELAGSGKDDLLVLHLLTHTSGLDDVLPDSAAPMYGFIRATAAQQLKGELGSRFKYADINFILLGELVRRVSGKSLDRYAHEHLYALLGMRDTCFNPKTEISGRCAATLVAENSPQYGLVQDYAARQLGGVAGHAGLFSTVRDLSLFCRMVLNSGSFDGKSVLAERTVAQMVAPYFSRGGKVVRGLGWDITSPFSSPRVDGFAENSFGHTGYSGSSVWIDPESGIYVIVLTSRLEYRRQKEFNQLRSDVSTVVATIYARRRDADDTASFAQ